MASVRGAIHGPPSLLSRRHPCRRIRSLHSRYPESTVHSRQHRGSVRVRQGRTRWGPSPHSRCPDPVESEATPAIPPLAPPTRCRCSTPPFHPVPRKPPKGGSTRRELSSGRKPRGSLVGANSASQTGETKRVFPCFTLCPNADTPRVFTRHFRPFFPSKILRSTIPIAPAIGIPLDFIDRFSP
jgi:hypothetical protein